ncbi:hypothetical protein D3C77_54840 [compost metagenome]
MTLEQSCYGGCARADFGLAEFPMSSVSHPAYSCHPNLVRRIEVEAPESTGS